MKQIIPTLTVFTPTYNRAHTLPKLYESLKRQTSKDFAWLIVDDGSIDDTRNLIEGWIKEEIVPIKYEYQQNAGKMKAHNRGAELSETELFVCIDSDDFLTDDAVESIINKWASEDRKETLAGIIAYKSIMQQDGKYKVICEFPHLGYEKLYMLYKNGFKGDTTLVFRTEIIKQYPFHIIKGEKFITEGSVYDLIDQNYIYGLLSKPLTLCEYFAGGYTKSANTLALNNPRGMAYYYNQYISIYKPHGIELLKKTSYYIAFSRLGKDSNVLKNSATPLYAYAISWVLSFIYQYKHLHTRE